MREVELKLLLDRAAMASLHKSAWAKRAGLEKAPRRRLRSTYFDTDDLRLKQAGMTLRVRQAGRKQIQTLKGESAAGSLAFDRPEYEAPLGPSPEVPDLALLPDDLRTRLKTLCSEQSFIPAFSTDVRRRKAEISRNGSTIEIALDEGSIVTRDGKAPIREVELELKQGSPSSLYAFAEELVEEVPVRLSLRAKSERGFALKEGQAITSVKAGSVLLPENPLARDVLVAALSSCLEQIVANEPAIIEAGDPEGIHQMRVGLRRLRSVIRLFARKSDPLDLNSSSHKARELAAVLGRARDLDVLEDELMAALPNEVLVDVNHDPVLRAIARARKEAWAATRTSLTEPEFAKFLLGFAARIEKLKEVEAEGALARPAPAFAAAQLEKAAAKAAKLGQNLKRLSTPKRHELRKELKKLRYAAHTFAGLFPGAKTRAYLKRLEALQDSLGALNDVAVAETTLASLPIAAQHRTAAAHATGFLLGYHARRAETDMKEAARLWKKFEKAAPFWRA